MPWNMKDFPASMKNLDKLTRKKAIDIANALLDEGYPDSRAIPIAIDQAKEWYENASESERRTFEKEKNPSKSDKHDTNPRAGKLLDSDVIVEYAKEQWIVKSKGAKKASNHFDTKKEAIEKGKQVAQNKESTLVIYKKDGTKEKEIDY
ncbi:DUF2188 domain-containing protein [Enterococcus faecium]|uniref:DUF2188 domain-containing protein n=1 Tax=Enterococcus faecium TaxID=1352 RepID=UPI001BDBF7EA|nr:DUF2188 domain-containing protein [Enterococcus faecium]MCL6156541.1 DUF2188 domain-containing protein [Enterococcus faecium]MCL6159384.1 DUF2188 domain-containing protein [Enterococcus faecium]MCU1844106.1 DUF2188 domain-containing protein [Enterococcus faecium]MCU2115529.1 DUF2188 domain-containing protein [Enterococcus faecium]MCU2155404.1 DUF2188 domain-containing protein [Enterococcus faecium]